MPNVAREFSNDSEPKHSCHLCGGQIRPQDRYCASCGTSAGQIIWSLENAGRDDKSALPVDSLNITIPEGGDFYIVAVNRGTIHIPVEIDTTMVTGIDPAAKIGTRARNVPPGGSVRFELRHMPGAVLGGVLHLRSRDGLRQTWWDRDSWRVEKLSLAYRVRVHTHRWLMGSPVVLFPLGVRRQRIRVWNDAPEKRTFDTILPSGYRATYYTLPLERNPQTIAPGADLSLTIMAESLPGIGAPADAVWFPTGESVGEQVLLRCLASSTPAAGDDVVTDGPDVVIALDFGTCNTSVRVRWRRTLIAAKPSGTVDPIGDGASDIDSPSIFRYPTCMIFHKQEATFFWGVKAQGMIDRNDVREDHIVMRDLKTDIRNHIERHIAVNPRWTNEYLLGRYFEQIFTHVDRYLADADPRQTLRRSALDIRYVVTRPVLDANEGDKNGTVYETALLLALQRSGVAADHVVFVHEPEAAALGIARRRREELLALSDGTPIAVIDSGGGTTDVAVARVRHLNGEVSLDTVGTYRLELSESVPGRINQSLENQPQSKDHEFGGNVLDEVMTFYASNDAAKIADADDGPPPSTINVPGFNQENTLRSIHKNFKERFVYAPKQYYNRSNSERSKGEFLPLKGSDDLVDVYVDHGLFANSVAFPLLRQPIQYLLTVIAKHQTPSMGSMGVLPVDIKQIFFVGGTSIDSFVRQAFAEAFPAVEIGSQVLVERLTEKADADAIVDEKLNAVVNGAVWYGERLGQPSPVTLTIRMRGREDLSLIRRGDTLLPSALTQTFPLATKLAPGSMLEVELLASEAVGINVPLVVACAFYRNDSEQEQEVTLRCWVTEEEGCEAEIIIEGGSKIPLPQWKFLMTAAQR